MYTGLHRDSAHPFSVTYIVYILYIYDGYVYIHTHDHIVIVTLPCDSYTMLDGIILHMS